MTITIVCDILGEENNGTTIACMNLIRFLRAQGHTIRTRPATSAFTSYRS